MSTILAYHNDPERKTMFVAELKSHQAADRFMRGTYWNPSEQRGCAVGCSIESITRHIDLAVQINHNDHAGLADWLGIPVSLAFLEDRLFEGVGIERSKTWPVEFAEAIPAGADLVMVVPRFLHWLLSDADGAVQKNATEGQVRDAVNQVAALYGRWVETGVRPDDAEFESARSAARSAAWSAVWSAAESAAAAAAWSAAWSAAESAARSAAESAAEAAAAAAAAAYERMADKLLALMAEARTQ